MVIVVPLFGFGVMRSSFHPEAAGTVYLDASPWGLGGVFVTHCKVHSYFACAVTGDDVRILGVRIGDSDSQQTLEALVALVAFRPWVSILKSKRIVLALKSDNTSALAMASSLKITAINFDRA